MASGFIRQEVLAMTGIKPGNLSYLDSADLVKPQKNGNPKRPTVIYSVEQVLQIKIIQRLREKLPLQEICKVLRFLQARNYQPSLFNCNLVFIEKQLYLIEDTSDFGARVLEASGKNKGQIVIHQVGSIGDVIPELRREAYHHQVLDFDKRSRGTLLDLANPQKA